MLAAAMIWMTTFQPLFELGVGALLGVRYEYAYLWGVELRFKMRYGTYVAAPRWARIAVHLSGTLGSPVAALVVSKLVRSELPLANSLCTAAFWITVAINVLSPLSAVVGLRRIGRMRLAVTSGGAEGAEVREALLGGIS